MIAAGLHHVPEILTRSVMLLDLAGNQLQEILDGDFDSYPYLRQLDLSNNQISYIQDDALGRTFSLTELEVLDLSYNELRAMPSLTLPELKILRIEGNGLLTLGDNFLLNFPRLTQLHAAGNNLTCEESNWLAIKIILTGVNLRKGCWNLTTIETGTTESQETTTHIHATSSKIININPKKKPAQENTSSNFKKPIVYNIIFRVNKPRRQIPINTTDRISNLTKPVPQKRVAETKGRPIVKTSALVEHPPEKVLRVTQVYWQC
ncbi:leucine-rich repeat-containing protein 32-like [Ctenocephalides felis]|uniref:leucine-rich repeat-containing protein 32-like n=1 Tax=Ctenocephalides felis TaxID=7515 RepID=UPI000E6E2B5A|nr:leucine-rich repeat-containing protein 32-like [Ctenocephalides felis]